MCPIVGEEGNVRFGADGGVVLPRICGMGKVPGGRTSILAALLTRHGEALRGPVGQYTHEISGRPDEQITRIEGYGSVPSSRHAL